MKSLIHFTCSILSIALTLSLLTFAIAETEEKTNSEQAMEHKFEKAKEYYAECSNVSGKEFEAIKPYLKAFTDVEVMADTMANPQRFAQLMMVVNDPRTMHVMMKCAMEPVMWETWMRGLSDPTKMMNAAARFMNPMMYFNWAMAPMNPQMYAPMMAMMNPQYYMNWMTAMSNPAFYNPMTAMMDPNWYTHRMTWMMNPESYTPMFGMMGGMPMSYVADSATSK